MSRILGEQINLLGDQLSTRVEPHHDRLTADRWDQFVKEAGGHYTQTSAWAEVKGTVGWAAERVTARRDGELVGGAQALFRKVPLAGSIVVVPSTPPVRDPGALAVVIDELLALCTRRRVTWLKLQPTAFESGEFQRVLCDRGFVASDVRLARGAAMRVKLQADPDAVIASLRKGLRANIRKAKRRGAVVVREGGERDLSTFADLLAATAERQPGMHLFPRRYYEQAWRSFTSRGTGRLLVAEHEGRVLSAILLIVYGDTCEYLYGGWNREHPDLHPNEFLQWSAIEWACREGLGWYDLGNIDLPIGHRLLAGERVPTNAATGQTRYKLGFNGEVQLSPPAYDQTGRPILRPVVRLVAPKLTRTYPAINWARGLVR